MKGLGLWIICLIASLIASSQTLKPTKIQRDSTVYRCFDELQTKAIVKIIVGKQYCDSIQDVNAQLVTMQDSIIKSQKSLISTIQLINVNNNGQITNLNILNSTLRMDMNKAQASNARLKKSRWLYFGVGVLTSATAVYLMK